MPDMSLDLMCGWCAQPVCLSAIETRTNKGDGVVMISNVMAAQYAMRNDGVVWHPECFVKYLAHKDEIQGIDRTKGRANGR